MSVHLFGIRHHGPGSARSLRKALEELQPDIVLIEGPPDAQEVLPLAADAAMVPPVAILIYVPDEPNRACYDPFAVFSPEWQAIQYGFARNIPVRFMDLPQAIQLAREERVNERREENPTGGEENERTSENNPNSEIERDPLRWVAEAAGYSDPERWWEQMVEQRQDSTEVFAAILELMTALREESPDTEDERGELREAFMRQTIREAQREGFERIAVVCGAWHAPALVEMPPAKRDAEKLMGLPKIKVTATWIPWTYGRLTYYSGYGAGVNSPAWYHHLWECLNAGRMEGREEGQNREAWEHEGMDMSSRTEPIAYPHASAPLYDVPARAPLSPFSRLSIGWMARVANLFREADLDASPAHVIEAVRLAETLAALRDRSMPGLPELCEAVQTVFCYGDNLPMRLVSEKLIVGERLGSVPEETPQLPLQLDLQREQKRLRLPPEASHRDYDLDLRKPLDLERSHLLHRLSLLHVPWGKPLPSRGKGTFWENWRLQWQPEFALGLIEANVWGNTVLSAATASVRATAQKSDDLPAVTALVQATLLASLPDAIGEVMSRLQYLAALTSDVLQLMEALPPLVQVLRYGNVRKTDAEMVSPVVNDLLTRICIGLPGACASLNDEAAREMFERIVRTHGAVETLQNEEHLSAWYSTLQQLSDLNNLHGLIAGRACWLLLQEDVLPAEEIARRMNLALSLANEPSQSAAWLEGFLQDNGTVLLHYENLWSHLDTWLVSLPPEAFLQVLPLLRRTFATFHPPERRQIGECVRHGTARLPVAASHLGEFDTERADQVLPLLAQIVGFTNETH